MSGPMPTQKTTNNHTFQNWPPYGASQHSLEYLHNTSIKSDTDTRRSAAVRVRFAEGDILPLLPLSGQQEKSRSDGCRCGNPLQCTRVDSRLSTWMEATIPNTKRQNQTELVRMSQAPHLRRVCCVFGNTSKRLQPAQLNSDKCDLQLDKQTRITSYSARRHRTLRLVKRIA
jgi:hypothetical protein